MQHEFFFFKLTEIQSIWKVRHCFFNKILNSIVSIPKYCDIVYDPDPEKSYTKAKLKKYIEYDKENVADNSSISSLAENPELLFRRDEVANEVFNNNFSFLPNFLPMDACQHIKNSGKPVFGNV